MRLLRLARLASLIALASAIGCGDDDPAAPQEGPTPEPLSFFNFHEAAVVIGQVGMTSKGPNASATISAQGFDDPWSSGAGTGPYYVPDFGNNRVLGFAEIPSSNGASATFVLGQPDFTSNTEGTSAQSFCRPIACAVYRNKLFVVDFSNNRMLIWNSLPTSNVPADVVVGQPDFTTRPAASVSRERLFLPTDVAAANGKLFVADMGNNRILIWNQIPSTNGAPADVVVGQTDFTTSSSGLSRTKFWSGGVLWTDGRRLAVGDKEQDRVLIWNKIPTSNGAPADVVVGAPDFTTGPTNVVSESTFLGIGGLASDGTSLFVCDIAANRILIFTPFPTSNGASAVGVIGQNSFTAYTANDWNQDGVNDLSPTERTLSIPTSISVQGNRLIVADNDNNRLLIYVSN